MITYRTGSIFDAKAAALVNPVNTVGAMGKGLALAFARRWPEMVGSYKAACATGEVAIGKCWSMRVHDCTVICFPTKAHWRDPSKIEYIEAGLVSLRGLLEREGHESVAIPALGCGLGGLDWPDVRSAIGQALSALRVDVTVYRPTGVAG